MEHHRPPLDHRRTRSRTRDRLPARSSRRCVAPLPALPDVQSQRRAARSPMTSRGIRCCRPHSPTATDIYDHLSPATFADIQQFAANVPDYLDGTRNFNTDLTTAYNAAIKPVHARRPRAVHLHLARPDAQRASASTRPRAHLFDIDLPGQRGLIDILTNGLNFDIGICPLCTDVTIPVLPLLVGDSLASQIEPYINFSGSPLSGILWGSVGTTLGPLLQLNDDITAITTALSGATPDYTTAFNDLLDMPANVTNAFLNGYGDINLDTLLTDFGIASPTTDAASHRRPGWAAQPRRLAHRRHRLHRYAWRLQHRRARHSTFRPRRSGRSRHCSCRIRRSPSRSAGTAWVSRSPICSAN